MIDKQKLTEVVEKTIEGTNIFLVDVKVSADNNIIVEIDSTDSLDIDTCANITRNIEAAFDRDIEDYELEVGSAGITSPFKVKKQFDKNIGREVEVVTRDGRKLKGVLTAATDTDFTIEVPTKVKEEGAKRPVVKMVAETIEMTNAKSVTCVLKF